jgi:FtsH-binding integral membrane protein
MASERQRLLDSEQGDTQFFEGPGNVKDQPPEIRTGFITKTYGLVFYMLLITSSISMPFFLNDRADVLTWLGAHPYILPLAISVMVGFYALNLAMVMSMVCCRSDGCYKMYMKMFTTFPVNLIFLTVFAAAFGCMVGIICMEYKVQSVVWIFGMCAVLIIALTIYAVKTKADVTGMGPYILVAVICFLMTGLILSLVDAAGGELGAGTNKIMGGLGAMLFGFLIVYDTQLIFGNSQYSGGERQIQYTIDLYAFAAFQLYLDFINFFIYMLQLLGDRR